MAPRLYLDHNATSPLRPEARAAMLSAFDLPGNPSSVHAEGRRARGLVERARVAVAALCEASPRDVIFTGCGTEANGLALGTGLRSDGDSRPFTHALIASVEHASVLESARFPTDSIRKIPVGADGLIDLDALRALLDDVSCAGGRALVAIQAANSETGIVQPIAALSQIVHAQGGILHCDAVQVAGKMPLDQVTAGADMIALSAHKIGGPQGVGALVIKAGGLVPEKLLRGGGQERGARSGTENVAGIAGFGAAAAVVRETLATESARLLALRTGLEAALCRIAPDAVLFGAGSARLPNTVAFAVPGLSAETALMAFDLAGVALSSGSACSSGKVRKSHVLESMGIDTALASGALRASFGWTNAEEDMIRFAAAFETVLSRGKTRSHAA